MFDENLIAPCRMNCGICKAYLAYSHNIPRTKGVTHCTGCRPRNKQCAYLKGQGCQIRNGEIRYCSECADFPCAHLRGIDNRYHTRYNYSFIENLVELKKIGADQFLKNQETRYKCPQCSGVISIHDSRCYNCGYTR
jgi:hypothetical protein